MGPRAEPAAAAARPRAFDVAMLAMLALFCCAPLAAWGLRGAEDDSPVLELRQPAPFPARPRSLAELRLFAQGVDAWYGDHFGLRGELVRLHALLSWSLLGGTPSPRLERGPDGWAWWNLRGELDAWRGLDPLDDRELSAWCELLEERRAWLAARGIQYLVVFVPAKAEVYPDHLPRGYARRGASRLDQLLPELRARTSVDVLDLGPALRAARAGDGPDDALYYRLGLHWTPRGAQAGAAAVLGRLRAHLPELHVRQAGGYRRVDGRDQGDSWARTLGLDRFIRQRKVLFEPVPPAARFRPTRVADSAHELHVFTNERDERPRALLLHDSFGKQLRLKLAESFGELRCAQTFDLDVDLFGSPAPQIVIQELAEQALSRYAPWFASFPRVDEPERAPAELERLFERSGEVLLRVDPRRGEPACRAIGTARLRPGREWGGAGLRVELGDESALVALPRVRPSPGQGAVLALELHNGSAPTRLELLSAPDGELRHDPTRTRRYPLARGRNRLFLELSPRMLAGELVLRPGMRARQVVFERIELRALPGDS